MALKDKYKELIDAAGSSGVSNFQAREQDGVLYIDGTAPSSDVKQKLWGIYEKLNPDFRSSDVVMNITAGAGEGATETYTVKSGDSLSKIATRYPGLKWQDIYEANKDKIKDPNMIYPGQKIIIP